MNTKLASLLALLPGVTFADFVDFGAQTTPLSPAKTTELSLATDSGFLVREVFAHTPAATLGLNRNDIVTQINGKPVFSITGLAELIAGTQQKGHEISVSWISNGENKSGKVKLDSMSTKAEFQQRYRSFGMSNFSFNTRDIDSSNVPGISAQVIPIPGGGQIPDNLPDDIKESIERALKGLDHGKHQPLGGAIGGSLMSSSISIHTEDGSCSIGTEKEGKVPVTIKDKEGNIIFDETVPKNNLSKVPEAWRDTIKMATSASQSFSFSITGDDEQPDNAPQQKEREEEEISVDDIIKQIEKLKIEREEKKEGK